MLTEELLQTLAALFTMKLFNSVILLCVICPFLILYALRLQFYKILTLYFVWFVYSTYRVYHGGLRLKWLRDLVLARYVQDYLPIRLIKTSPLDPHKNYVMGSHPHGIYGLGVFFNFNTDVTGFDKEYPGITPHLISLDSLFLLPAIRDALICFGNCASSKKSLEYILKKKGKGNLVILLVGGVDEVAESKPNEMTILLKKRKGFVKLAITTGADLVPSITFGENEVFPKRSSEKFQFGWIKKIEFAVKKYSNQPMNVKAIINFGLNAFLISYPQRVPVITVVGKPIEVVQNSNPNEETINYYHNKYIESIEQTFNEYKVKLGDKYKDLKLQII
ncbi:Diacylglycerol O-acyltransferase 2 [Chamberlinius hualienensis]